MKKPILFAAILAALVTQAASDVYRLTMSLRIPQVFDNTQSLGYRKYRTHKLIGTAIINYDGYRPEVTITELVNKTHKVIGVPVTYTVDVDNSRVNVIGNNKTGKFVTPSISFSIDAQPSYVASYKPTEDNSLILTLAGSGSSYKSISGYASGTLGCGCTAYGHTSPTRVNGACGATSVVDDVASVYGKWTMKRVKRLP